MQKLWLVTTVFIFTACNSQKEKKAQESRKAKQEEVFPIGLFFHEQVKLVDSLKLPTVKTATVRGKTTTESVSLEEFNQLAEEFIQSDISAPSLKGAYKETSFADQSIPSITLTYSTADSALEVQRVDVIIDPDPVNDDRVKSVYLEKYTTKADTFIQKKLYWKANENFQVITTKNIPSAKPIISQVKVSWNGMN